MTDEHKMRDCYEMAYLITRAQQSQTPAKIKNRKLMNIDVEDPLAVVCMAHLLYSWKYKLKRVKT